MSSGSHGRGTRAPPCRAPSCRERSAPTVQNHASSGDANGVPSAAGANECGASLLIAATSGCDKQNMNNLDANGAQIKGERFIFLLAMGKNPRKLPPVTTKARRVRMKHEEIWRALDALAAEAGMSPSGLARRAGLDATTFNPSKRRMPDGRARWPSTESLSKALDAAGASLETFAHLVTGGRAIATSQPPPRRIPLIGLAQAGADGFFGDAGYRWALDGTRSRSPKWATRTPMRWRFPANRWSRSTATAT